jgi:hypothetical protein
MTNEEYVRERVLSLSARPGEDGGYNVLLHDVVNPSGAKYAANGVAAPSAFLAWFRYASKSEAWLAARQFTEAREKEIEKRVEDIGWLKIMGLDRVAWDQHGQAILTREQAALDELRRGMKGRPQ